MKNRIISEAERLIRLYGRDPFVMAENMGIEIRRCDLGTLKGMYTVILGNRFIVINQNLSDNESRQVCAHELGHDVLHRAFEENEAFREHSLVDMDKKPEFEASAFAAEILLEDNEVLDFARQGNDLAVCARELGVDENLLLIKISLLIKKGFKINLPDVPRGDFLKNG